MNFLLFTLLVIFIIYAYFLRQSRTKDIYFLSQQHTYIAKGVAIMLVLLSHLGGAYGIRYLTPLGGIGVALFMICSGIGLNESLNSKGLDGYWTKKIKSVWFPYFLLQTFIFIASLFYKPISISDYLKDIFLIETIHPYGWYMQLLFIWYIIFFISSKYLSSNSTKRNFFLLIISISFIFIVNNLWAEQSLSFVTGVFASSFKTNNKLISVTIKNKLPVFSLMIIGLLFLGVKQFDIIRNMPYVFFNVIQLLIKLPLAIATLILIIKLSTLFSNKIFVILGGNAFYIYLIHAYTIQSLNKVSYINIIIFILITTFLVIVFKQTLQKKSPLHNKTILKKEG